MLDSARKAGYRSRNVKPRFIERDAEIERLHEEGLKPKEIHRCIIGNPKWEKNQEGAPLKYDAVYSVIRRLKRPTG